MIRVNFSITEQQIEQIKQIKAETGLAHSEIVRRSLDMFFIQYGKEKKERKEVNQKENKAVKDE